MTMSFNQFLVGILTAHQITLASFPHDSSSIMRRQLPYPTLLYPHHQSLIQPKSLQFLKVLLMPLHHLSSPFLLFPFNGTLICQNSFKDAVPGFSCNAPCRFCVAQCRTSLLIPFSRYRVLIAFS